MTCLIGARLPTIPVITPPAGTIYQYANVSFKFMSTHPQDKDIKYVVDWGDGTTDTSAIDYASGTEATMVHAWTASGSYDVKAMALQANNLTYASDWSQPTTVPVGANLAPGAPRIIYSPLQVGRNRVTKFMAVATDPEGDSVAYQWMCDGDLGDWTAFVPSGVPVDFYQAFPRIGTLYVKVHAKDTKGSIGPWSDSVMVKVDTTGVVVWTWLSPDEEEGPPNGSVLILTYEEKELVYVGAEDEFGKFYGINVVDGDDDERGSGIEPEMYFVGHAAYCAQTGNIIVGNEDGRLYGFTKSLSRNWSWPDSGDGIEWGAPAINGNNVYCARDDDKLYYFTDLTTDVRYEAAFDISGIMGSPVIDNAGNVIVGNDSGKLYKLSPDLDTVAWQVQLNASNHSVNSVVLGATGTIYCGDDDGNVYALNPADGSEVWKVTVYGEVNAIVLGSGAIYAATGSGLVYRLNPTTGLAVWSVALTGGSDILTNPILTTNGLMYVHDDQDVLHCLKQDDGALVWQCNCEEYAPAGAKRHGRRDMEYPASNPGITSTGDIIVVGSDALYCVAGYTDGTLATTAWPKWQHDRHNTGWCGGGW
jgi:outer membrane protein assembly factor BamB